MEVEQAVFLELHLLVAAAVVQELVATALQIRAVQAVLQQPTVTQVQAFRIRVVAVAVALQAAERRERMQETVERQQAVRTERRIVAVAVADHRRQQPAETVARAKS